MKATKATKTSKTTKNTTRSATSPTKASPETLKKGAAEDAKVLSMSSREFKYITTCMSTAVARSIDRINELTATAISKLESPAASLRARVNADPIFAAAFAKYILSDHLNYVGQGTTQEYSTEILAALRRRLDQFSKAPVTMQELFNGFPLYQHSGVYMNVSYPVTHTGRGTESTDNAYSLVHGKICSALSNYRQQCTAILEKRARLIEDIRDRAAAAEFNLMFCDRGDIDKLKCIVESIEVSAEDLDELFSDN